MTPAQQDNGVPDEQKRQIVGCGFAIALVIAPFLALLYGQAAGLAVLAGALATTLLAVIEGSRGADAVEQRRLRILAVINGIFFLLTLILLGALLLG